MGSDSREDAERRYLNKFVSRSLQTVTFDSEEAEAFAEYRRNQRAYETTVNEFEQAIDNHSERLGDNSRNGLNPLRHFFTDGQYVREITLMPDLILTTKLHNRNHPFFLLRGDMTIVTDRGQERIQAPHFGITAAGTKRIIYTHTECVFFTVHATDKLTVEDVDLEILAEDYSTVDRHPVDTEQIKKLIKQME